MKEMKYVVVKCDNGLEQIFIFSKLFNHDFFAEVLHDIREGDSRDWERSYKEPISAGFTDGESCYGESVTLGLKSRPVEDTKLLT